MHRAIEKEMAKNKNVVFFHIQTVFEGAGVNTPARGVRVARRLGIKSPVLHDARVECYKTPEVMRTYRTRGTPWTIVIGKSGRVLMSRFTPGLKILRALVLKALEEKWPVKKPSKTKSGK